MVKESGNANFSLGSPGSYCGRDDATVSGNINVDLAASSGSAGYEPGNVDGDNVKLKRQSDPFFC